MRSKIAMATLVAAFAAAASSFADPGLFAEAVPTPKRRRRTTSGREYVARNREIAEWNAKVEAKKREKLARKGR